MSKNITCLYCTVSVVVKMLPAPLIGVGKYYLFVVRGCYRCSGVVYMSFCVLFSVVWSLQLGFIANGNVAKPVIVCKSEEQRDVLRVRIMYLDRLVWSGKRLGRLFGFGRTRAVVRKLFMLL